MPVSVEIISAPSILGLRPSGVENLPYSLLHAGLAKRLNAQVKHVHALNADYNVKRDPQTHCLNPSAIRDFSLQLSKAVTAAVRFPIVLGGDCSILLGIMPALKAKGQFGLIFLDAHADFYEPVKSVTGEVADMDLAMVTGRGPMLLTNINGLRPYVKDEHVVHIGQRDEEETERYGSQDIRETAIKCFSLKDIERDGIDQVIAGIVQYMQTLQLHGYWIHFDTDVLSDEINPAVDYRLPGGLFFEQVTQIIQQLMAADNMIGMSVTCFNPKLDADGSIAKGISDCIANAILNKALLR